MRVQRARSERQRHKVGSLSLLVWRSRSHLEHNAASRAANVVESVTAALTLQQLDASPPPDGEKTRLAERFILLFRRPNKVGLALCLVSVVSAHVCVLFFQALSSAVKQLEDMLRYYSDLMYVEVAEAARNGLELCCARDTLMHKVKVCAHVCAISWCVVLCMLCSAVVVDDDGGPVPETFLQR
jgi:hypothetical protein